MAAPDSRGRTDDAEDAGHLDLGRARELFEASTDFTIGLEEEFAIVDPQTLDLRHRFEDMYAACLQDELLAESAAGELIASEIEIRSGKAETFAQAMELQREHRARLFALADEMGLALAAMGTHPWADYLDQRIIDTPHYARLRAELRWVAQRNNTWSLHVHVGVRGADRAVAVCDHLRGVLPALLAVSANSPCLDGRDTGLHSVRTEIFTRTFPRCGIHQPFGSWKGYADFVDLLVRTNSIVEATQLWWSVRPHHTFGTVELRICDAQTRGEESFGLAALIAACIAQSALDYDEGRLPEPLGQREIEENLWRAIRYGTEGLMIDFDRGEETPAQEAVERLVEWTAPARDALGLEVALPGLNGARRARRALDGGASIEEVYRVAVAETRRTYVPEGCRRSERRGAAGAAAQRGGASPEDRRAAARGPSSGPAARERGEPDQPHRAPNREGGRARPRPGPGGDRGGARGPRPARRGARQAGARRPLGDPDALCEAR